MHEQEFERSVQQKMEELSFEPSAPVWEKLEQELRTKKRRRRFALWLLPAAIVGLGVTFYTFSGVGIFNDKKQVSANKTIQKRVATGHHQHVTSKRIGFKNDASDKKLKGINTASSKIELKDEPSKYLKNRQAGVYIFSALDAAPAKRVFSKKAADGADAIRADAKVGAQLGTAPFFPIHTTNPVPRLPVSISTRLQDLQLTQNILPIQAPDSKKAPQVVRWQWGIDAQYGWANTNDAGLFSAANLDRLNDPAPNNPGGFGGGNAVQPLLQTAPGTFFTTAFHLQRSIDMRIGFAAGIRYSLYTLRLRVGEKVNPSSINFSNVSADAMMSQSLYKPDTANAYFQSRYHQASMPLSLQMRPFKKMPLEAEAGLAFGYLWGTKMLRYDTAARLYYVAKPTVQHFQVQAQASVRYRLAQTNKWQWLAVTQMHYHLSDLHTAVQPGKKLYALSAGIQLRKK